MDTTSTPRHDAFDADAMDWLQGRLRWERILRNLHDKAEGTTPIVSPAEITEIELTISAEDDRAA
jgi:hypothetical protein